MGCDIHAYIEVREDYCEHWFCFAELRLNRDYNLFGILAGVRREKLKLYNPKGIPVDLSGIVISRLSEWGDDAHTNSYLYLGELKKVYKKYKSYELLSVIKLMKSLEKHNNNYKTRLVFWFDN